MAGDHQTRRPAVADDRFFELSIDPLCVIDRHGYIARANPALEELLGYSANELVTMHVSAIIHPDDEITAMNRLQSYPAEPMTSLQLRCRTRGGDERLIVWNIQPDPVDGSLYASGRDITERRATERSLHESRERLRLATKAVNLHTWEADVIGEELHWSRDEPQLVDVPLPGTFEEFHAALHPDDRDRVIDTLRRAIATEGEFRFEYRFANQPLRDQTWLLSAGIAIRDDEAGLTRIVGITQDITDRIRRQRQSEFLAALGTDFAHFTSPEEVIRAASTRTLDFFNATALTIGEFNDDDRLNAIHDSRLATGRIQPGDQLDELLDEELISELKRGKPIAISDVATDPRTTRLANRFQQAGLHAVLLAPSTRRRHFHVILALQRDQPGEWQPWEISLLDDVAWRLGLRLDRARWDRALRESEARYRSLFTSIDEGFCIIERLDPDADGNIDFRYLTANPAFTLQAGVDNVIGKTMRDVIPDEYAQWAKTYDRLLKTRKPIRFTQNLETTGRILELYAFPLDDAPDSTQVGVIFQDVTGRKEAERALLEKSREAEEAVHARDVFLSIASHELRNPVASIKGSAQMLRRSFDKGRLDEARTDRLTSAIVDSSERLAVLLEDLLDVSRLQSGQMHIKREPADLVGIVDEVVRQEYSEFDGHKIELDLAEGPPVAIDRERIRQVLQNLIDNAIKYSPDGGTIQVTVTYDAEGALVSISDPGIGIPTALLESVFQPFGRAPNAAETNIPGMGLGLFICRNIALAHDGWLWAESAGEDQGLTMYLKLPFSSSPAT